MNSETCEDKNWEEVIGCFFQKKSEDEEEKFLKAEIKKIADLYKGENYYGDAVIEQFFDPKKNKKEKEQTALDFQRLKFKQVKDFSEKPQGFAHSVEAYDKQCLQIAEKFEPNRWITKASQDAKSVSFATHVSKLTHSKITSPSLLDQIVAHQEGVMTTADLKEVIVDGAVAGNQFAPVFQFLELECNGVKLATVFSDESNTVLKRYSTSSGELMKWNIGFKQALTVPEISTHLLAKQLYFPITKDTPLTVNSYHLLANIKSSSLAHAIFMALGDQQQKVARKQREKNKFSKKSTCSFPRRANLQVTASNHSNASQLNGKRGGRLQLFNCQPPQWHSELKSPVNRISFFYARTIYQNSKETINYLRDFLLWNQHANLSIKKPDKKKWIEGWVNQIIDEVFTYVFSIQNISAGWSGAEKIKLKAAHRYLLDPYRIDEQFRQGWQTEDWQTVICVDFAKWLNGRLVGKDKKFTPQSDYSRMWQDLMTEELREHCQTLEFAIKQQREEMA